ncbi:MAG: VOC family protein [Chthoniobacterales bacterium]
MSEPTAIRSLGEIALRVNNLPVMKRFYGEVLRLPTLGEFPNAVFFNVGESYGGHTQVIALFDRSVEVSQRGSTVDHIAFAIALDEFEREKSRLELLGLSVELATHKWVKWRSLYLRDPEGNQVELVCYDPAVV